LYKDYESYIIPRRFHNTYWNISHYVNNFTPNQIEEEVCRFENDMYSWMHILRRILHTRSKLKNIIMSTIIQISMKKVYKDQSKLIKQYQLPPSEDVTVSEWMRFKNIRDNK